MYAESNEQTCYQLLMENYFLLGSYLSKKTEMVMHMKRNHIPYEQEDIVPLSSGNHVRQTNRMKVIMQQKEAAAVAVAAKSRQGGTGSTFRLPADIAEALQRDVQKCHALRQDAAAQLAAYYMTHEHYVSGALMFAKSNTKFVEVIKVNLSADWSMAWRQLN